MTTSERSLATILFTDIVGSTERATELGDRQWHQLLEEHHARVRRELRRFGGRELNTSGDGFLAVFEGPARGIACADALRQAIRDLRLETRCGIHHGEVEGSGKTVGGIGVHIAARVMAEAGPGEILVSRSVRDAVEGSGIGFEDRGPRVLKGVEGERRLYAVTSVPADIGRGRPSAGPVRALLRRPLSLGIAAGALVLVGVLYATRRDTVADLTPEEAIAADAAPGIAVLPFTVNDPDLATWREGMVDLMTVNLDGIPGLRPIASRTVLARWRDEAPDVADLGTSLLVARRTGARYALIGSAVAVGSEVRFSADVYDAREGELLGSAQAQGSPDSVLTLVDQLSIEILRAILHGEEGDLPDVDLAGATTSSLPALKAYLGGEVLFRRGNYVAAIPAYERAVEADSTFAMANWRLATAYSFTDAVWSDLGQGAFERALRHADSLPEHEAVVLRADWALNQGNLAGIEPLEREVRRRPDDAVGWYVLGETYSHLGDEALIPPEKTQEALARAVQLDPRFGPAYTHRIDYAMLTADSARVAALIDSVVGLTDPIATEIEELRAMYDLAFGDSLAKEQAWRTIEQSDYDLVTMGGNFRHPRFRDVEGRLYEIVARHGGGMGTVLAAWSDLSRGRPAAVLERVTAPDFRFPDIRALILVTAEIQGFPIPAAELEKALAIDPADLNTDGNRAVFHFFRGAWAADQSREADRVAARGALRDLAARARMEGDSTTARFADGAGVALDGLLAWKRSDLDLAKKFLEEARVETVGYLGRMRVNDVIRWWMGELLVEQGKLHEAEPYFASLSVHPMAEKRRGDLYVEIGEPEKARVAYERFLTAWRDAEPEMAPMVARVREALARLPKPLRREAP